MASPKLAFSPHQTPAPDAVDRRLSGGDHRAVEADSDLAAIAERNYVGAYRKLVEHIPAGSIRLFGAVTAFTTGLPIGSASVRSWHGDLQRVHRGRAGQRV